ncbi:unnamed protein product [Miscanthus lutarioriparius]|uniref:Uncharacterized protein n=1 Tax=Miscanthus lutarioriparius TaxID=422564 RepID=A0A811QRK5_9POAL|nr:unnamed protein product [Miscanthus lutarioriparius]
MVTTVPSSISEPPQEQPSHADPFATPTRAITSVSTTSPVTRSMSRRLLEYEAFTLTRAIASISTPSPLTRSRKRMLELEGNIEHVQCLTLSPYPAHEKGKPKKLKVVRSKKA